MENKLKFEKYAYRQEKCLTIYINNRRQGASLKIQQVHANLLVWNRNVRVLFLNMKNITFRTTLRYGVRFQGDDHLADNLSTRRKEIYSGLRFKQPIGVCKCLFICLANDYYWMHFHSGWDQQKLANILHALDNEIQYQLAETVGQYPKIQ